MEAAELVHAAADTVTQSLEISCHLNHMYSCLADQQLKAEHDEQDDLKKKLQLARAGMAAMLQAAGQVLPLLTAAAVLATLAS